MMGKRKPKKAPAKPRKSADEIAQTSEYQAMLKDIVALIEAAKKQGAFGPRMTKRNRRKNTKTKGKGKEGSGNAE